MVTSLGNLSKLKMIYPVGLGDVELSLKDEPIQVIDILICFKEKKRR